MYINIAPLGKITFSSKTPWTALFDEKELVMPSNNYTYSFHTEKEDSPYFIIDFCSVYTINIIQVVNRLDDCSFRARSLTLECFDDINTKPIYSFEFEQNWGDYTHATLPSVKARYIKFCLKEKTWFHLKRIEVFADVFIPDCFIHNNLLSKLLNQYNCYIQDTNINKLFFYYNWSLDKQFSIRQYFNIFNSIKLVVHNQHDRLSIGFQIDLQHLDDLKFFDFLNIISKSDNRFCVTYKNKKVVLYFDDMSFENWYNGLYDHEQDKFL